jgi:hypothetical protein
LPLTRKTPDDASQSRICSQNPPKPPFAKYNEPAFASRDDIRVRRLTLEERETSEYVTQTEFADLLVMQGIDTGQRTREYNEKSIGRLALFDHACSTLHFE